MKISFIYVSNRPGGIDLLATCMANQNLHGADLEWELVVIDGWPGRVERRAAERHLRDAGIPLRYYGTPKLRTFPWTPTGYANAVNTGLIYCSGTHAVILHDFCWLPPALAVYWGATFREHPRAMISGVGIVYVAPPPDVTADAVERSEGETDAEHAARAAHLTDIYTWRAIDIGRDWDARDPWVPERFETGHWGGPMEFFENCNGVDERADFAAGWASDAVAIQADLHGYDQRVERRIVIHRCDHKSWEGPKEAVPEPTPKPTWTGWSANSYVLRDERANQLRLIK